MKFCGIDLHSTKSVVVVTNETDEVLVHRRCPNDLPTILAVLEPHRPELAGVVVESTYHWYWLVDGLQAAGYTVKLANTVAMRPYDGLKHSDDADDAAHLAHRLRLGIVPTGYVHPPEERALRDLGRQRIPLVRGRTQQVLAVENIVARQRGSRLSSNAIKRLTSEEVADLGLGAAVTLALQTNVAMITEFNAQIARLEERLHEGVKPRAEQALLKTVPGIGETLATVILLEVGDIARFPGPGNFASYARCVDSARYSNGKNEGCGQHQERQRLPGVGLRRGRPLRAPLQRPGQALLRPQEGEDQCGGGHQGPGAHAGAGVLPHLEGETAVRCETVFQLTRYRWRSASIPSIFD